MFSCAGNKVGNPFVTAESRMKVLALAMGGEGSILGYDTEVVAIEDKKS